MSAHEFDKIISNIRKELLEIEHDVRKFRMDITKEVDNSKLLIAEQLKGFRERLNALAYKTPSVKGAGDSFFPSKGKIHKDCNHRISELGLSVRAHTTIKSSPDFVTDRVLELSNKPRHMLFKLRNFGVVAYDEVSRALDEHAQKCKGGRK